MFSLVGPLATSRSLFRCTTGQWIGQVRNMHNGSFEYATGFTPIVK